MKRIWFKRSLWQSVLSLVVLGVFGYFAISSLGGITISQQKKYLDDGVYEVTKTFWNGKKEVVTGKTDGYNNWHGHVIIRYYGSDGNLISTEWTEMLFGKRHGETKIFLPNGLVKLYCYETGIRVECEKSAIITENSAYDIFNYKYPWFAAKLNAFDFTDEYIRAFMDTLEIIIGENEFDISEFDSHYDGATDILEETYYDSIIVVNAEFSIYNGAELINFDEFRLAAIDQQRSTERNIYNTVKSRYSNYLLKLRMFEITESDFQVFGQKFDSLMNSYDALDLNDPFFVDSVDTRMFRAISFIANEEDAQANNNALKSMVLSDSKPNHRQLLKLACSHLKKAQLNKSPQDVATVIATIILMKLTEGDLVKTSLYEAFSLKKGVVNLATVTTGFPARNSNSSVTLKGNIISDGGGDIITKGIYYGTVYNPDSTNFSIVANNGNVNFEVTINELSEGVTYYARAFAKNSAGIAYGNCISFTTNALVGTEINKLSEKVFDIFPNPTAGLTTFRFNLESAGNTELVIVNVNGQIVVQKNLGVLPPGENKIQLNLSTLETGIYNCRLTNNRAITGTGKFIVAR
jgi:hypothetical protein